MPIFHPLTVLDAIPAPVRTPLRRGVGNDSLRWPECFLFLSRESNLGISNHLAGDGEDQPAFPDGGQRPA